MMKKTITKEQKEEICIKAGELAHLIENVDSDFRGDLLHIAGNILQLHCQGYTGKLLIKTGLEYGIHEENR